MALSYINNKEIKFGASKPLNGVYTPGSPTREYEPLDSLGIYLNSGIPLSYGVENNRYMSMSDKFAATSQGNSYSFNQFFAAQMMLGFKLHDRFIACDTEHKIIGTEPLLQKAYLAEITEKTLDYFKIKIYGDKTRTFCIRMSSSEVPTSYVDLTNSFDENGLSLTQTDRQSFLSYYRFYPLTARDPSSRFEETLGVDYYLLPSAEGLKELSGDILSKFNAFISSDGSTLTNLGNTAFAYAGDINYALNYKGETPEAAVSAAKKAEVILGQVEEMHAGINQILPEMEKNLELTKQYRDEAMSTEIGTVREDVNQLKGDIDNLVYKNFEDLNKNKTPYLSGYEMFSTGGINPNNAYNILRFEVNPNTEYLLYRISPDNTPEYGYAINLHVIKLFETTTNDFLETHDTSAFIKQTTSIEASFTTASTTKYIFAQISSSVDYNYIVLIKGNEKIEPDFTHYPFWFTHLNNLIKVNYLDNEFSRIDAELSKTNDKIIKINTKSYTNSKWVAIGDSLTDRNTLSAQSEKENYFDFCVNELNLNGNNYGVGGTGYAGRNEYGQAFYQRANTIPEDTDFITIFGSGNDSSYVIAYRGSHGGSLGSWNDNVPSDFDDNQPITDKTIYSYYALVNHTIDNVLKRCPYASIGIVTPTPWKDNEPSDQTNTIMRLMSEALIDIAKHRGIPYLDLWACSQLHPSNDTFRSEMFLNGDGVHPLSKAHKKYIFPHFRQFIKTLK